MKRILLLLFMIPSLMMAQKIDGIFKYATIYSSVFANTPMKVRSEYYINQMGEIKDITIENPFDYQATFGIRRVARFDYENRRNRFYDGQTESTISLNANVGSVRGFEYLAQYDLGRQQGREYKNERYFLRHLSKYFMIKGEYFSQGLINLRYGQTDARLRAHIREVDFSLGIATRQNKPYGYNPVEDLLDSIPWFAFAYGQGFSDFMYGIDNNLNDSIDDYDWRWEDLEGNEIADSDEDFRRHVFPDLMRRYNRDVLDSIGYLGSLSAIAGVDYYHYEEKFWIHTWANVLFVHQHIVGDEHFSYQNYVDGNQWIDYSGGFVFGWKLGKSWGIFTEAEFRRYWDRQLFNLRAGINYQIR